MKDSLMLGFGQMLFYCLITMNMRAVAHDHLGYALLTDGLLQTVNFFVIRKLVKSEADTTRNWAFYTVGGLIGTTLGMRLV